MALITFARQPPDGWSGGLFDTSKFALSKDLRFETSWYYQLLWSSPYWTVLKLIGLHTS